MVNARDVAIRSRRPDPGGVVHADHRLSLISSTIGSSPRRSALPSFGTVGDGLDNAMIESFWSSMQIELLGRRKRRTRTEPADAIFEYIEVFYNRKRRHSAPRYRTPHEYEIRPPQIPENRWNLASPSGNQGVGRVKM